MFAKRVNSVIAQRRDPYSLQARRAEQMDRVLEGMVGLQLRKLLVPLILLYLRKRRRVMTVKLRSQTTTAASTSQLAEYCLLHPFLAPLGRDAIGFLLAHASRECYFPDDVILCPREPSRSVGIVVCTAGKLVVRTRSDASLGVVDMISRLRISSSSSSTTSILQGDFIGVQEEGDTLLISPLILGAMRALTDMSNPNLVVAQTTVDAFCIPYDLLQNVIAGRENRLPRREPSRHSRCILSDCSFVLVPRLLTVQTQFRLSMLWLYQSWIMTAVPDESIQEVLSKMECRCYAPGDVIVERGHHVMGVYFLRRGMVRVAQPDAPAPRPHGTTSATSTATASPDPSEDIILFPGSVMGERGALFHDRSKETLVAHTFCDVWVLPLAELNRFRSNGSVQAMFSRAGVTIATDWLQHLRNEEHEQLQSVGAKADAMRDALSAVVYNKEATSPQSMGVGVGGGAGVSLLTAELVQALRSVAYLNDAPGHLLLELAAISVPQVFLAHSSMCSTSSWCSSLFIITKGTATVQHGLTMFAPPPAYSWSYSAGSCVGMECVVEHRTMVPTCSVTMVEAWVVPRHELRRLLCEYGLLHQAVTTVELVLKDLTVALTRSVERKHANRTIDDSSTERPMATSDASPPTDGTDSLRSGSRRNAKSSLRLLRSPSPADIKKKNQMAASTVRDSAKSECSFFCRQTAPVKLDGVEFQVDLRNSDINRGRSGMCMCLRFLSTVETVRHERYSLMFPHCMDLICHRHTKEEAQRKESDRHAERYKALAEQYLTLDAGRESPSIAAHHAADAENIAHNVVQSFVEANAKADEMRLTQIAESQSANASWTEVAQGDSIESDDDVPMGGLVRRRASSLVMEGMVYRHVYPCVFFAVEFSEYVGDRSPWLLQLLGRDGGVWGYLEGSRPQPGTMIPTGSIKALANKRASLFQFEASRLSRRPTLQEGDHRASRSGTVTIVPNPVFALSHRKSNGKENGSTTASYKPVNPHSYAAQLPDAIVALQQRDPLKPTPSPYAPRRSTDFRTFRDMMFASGVIGKLQGAEKVALRLPGTTTSTSAEDIFDTDIISRVLHQGQTDTTSRSALKGKQGEEDKLIRTEGGVDTNYFEEEWNMMIDGRGIYSDGTIQTLRMSTANRRKQQRSVVQLSGANHKRSKRPSRATLLAQQDPSRNEEGGPATLDKRGTEKSPRGSPLDRPRRRTTITAPGIPFTTPFLEEYSAHLRQANQRLETNTRKAAEELEKPLPRVIERDEGDTNSSGVSPSISGNYGTDDGRRTAPRQFPPGSMVAVVSTRPSTASLTNANGTRSALIVPVPPSRSSARPRM